jgi:hypothetical protein
VRVFEPIAGAIGEWGGGEEAVAVGGSGGDLAFDGGSDTDGVHCFALARFCRRGLSLLASGGLSAGNDDERKKISSGRPVDLLMERGRLGSWAIPFHGSNARVSGEYISVKLNCC